MDKGDDATHPFGILASAGRPLSGLTDEVTSGLLEDERHSPQESGPVKLAMDARVDTAERDFGISDEGDSDPNDLKQTGWGVIYAPGLDQRIKEALQPLIDHRKQQGAAPCVIFDEDGFRPGEDAYQWLKRRKVSLDVVNPALGVPYYLLIVAPPEIIPFEFQYTIDLYWAVGRLWFDTPDEFRHYAESVIQYETGPTPPTTRQVVLFAPEHEFDAATQLFTRQVALPLALGDGVTLPLGAKMKYLVRPFLGGIATKETLANILQGRIEGGPPAVLFSGGHGMQFDDGDARQLSTQGAMVCQDWSRLGQINADDWFAALDVPKDAKIHGLIHFMFACHGGGVPQFDNYDRQNGKPRQIAPRPFFSKLPQALLAHPNGGSLAVLAHIERAWAYSFQGDGGAGQCQGFRNVLSLLLAGNRIGQATDVFNMKWAAVSTRLSDAIYDRERDPSRSLRSIAQLWIARDDARNFMVIGDPAVRLRQSEMPPLA